MTTNGICDAEVATFSSAAKDGERARFVERDEILTAMLDNCPIVVWAIDHEATCIFHDGKGVEGTEVGRGALVGMNMLALYPQGADEGIRQALRGEKAHIVDEAEGKVWESWMVPIHDAAGRVLRVVGLSLDVTQQKRVEAELRAKLELIERQRRTIEDLSLPIIQVWDGVLTVPLTGIFDSGRAADMMDDLLAEVSRLGAKFVILDLTGVDVVDTATANRLLMLLRAISLLGGTGVVTGIRPSVAQTIVSLEMNLSHIRTFATLRDGLKYCMRAMDGSSRA
jgi:rsbT co-antagonist protein RsbR